MPKAAVKLKNGIRPPKHAISPVVQFSMNLPSASGDHHGARRSPPSPCVSLPSMFTSAQKRYALQFSNLFLDTPPSSEKLQVWRFAKPKHARLASVIWIDA